MNKKTVFYIVFVCMCLTSIFSESVFLDGTVILGRPTKNTVTASICTVKTTDLYIEWGTKSGVYDQKSITKQSSLSQPAVFELQNLGENSTNFYRIGFKNVAEKNYAFTQECAFKTPPSLSQSYNFVIQADSHLLNKADKALYTQVMQKMAALKPDFLIDLGDTFLNDQAKDINSVTAETVAATYRQQLPFFDIVARTAPLFLVIGNHEGEYKAFFDGTKNNLAAKSTLMRTTYYPNPVPNDFYSGNSEKEALFGAPQNYYAFTWGDALFIAIDPYRYSDDGHPNSTKKSDGWSWSLGKTQYDWFKKTLENSTAKYKFVFAHHVLGNTRGGALVANLYEWGGYDKNGAYLFDQKRPQWGKPIQQIMKDENVTAFFQGHDHVFSRENVDGVPYITLPKPAEKIADIQSNYASYPNGDTLLNSGFLNVAVNPDFVQIDYMRTFFVASGTQKEHTGVVYSFTIDKNREVRILKSTKDDLESYGKNEETLNQTKNNAEKKEDNSKNPKSSGKKNDDKTLLFGTPPEPKENPLSVPQGAFSFAVFADPHFDENTDSSLLEQSVAQAVRLKPDFIIDLGDLDMIEKLAKTDAQKQQRRFLAQKYLSLLSKTDTIPVYTVSGNHDERKGKNYYSFIKNNALFVVLDPYTFSPAKIGNDPWNVTLGKTQYDWLKTTLENNTADFTFIFIHNLTGGMGKDQRGGAEAAEFFEWGGKNRAGVFEFTKKRVGWDMPIHHLLVKNGVTAVFHGHDHFYAHQQKDGITYQLVAQPGTTKKSVSDAESYGYANGTFLPAAGFLRCIVTNKKTTIEYIKVNLNGSFLVADSYEK